MVVASGLAWFSPPKAGNRKSVGGVQSLLVDSTGCHSARLLPSLKRQIRSIVSFGDVAIAGERLQEGTWANMVSNVREGDKAQIRHQATRSAVGCSRPRWNCRPVALVSSCKP